MPDEIKIELDKLPPIVLNKAKQLLPKTTWHSAVKLQDNGKIAYELDGSTAKDDDVTLTITAEGKIVEWDVKLSDPTKTPAKVLDAVKKKWPKFELMESHLLRLGEDLKNRADGDHLYDLYGTRMKGRNVNAQVSVDGELLEFVNELSLERVPKAVSDALTAKHPRFTADTVYAISENDTIIGYKYEGKGPKGREKSYYITADGKHVELVEDQD